MCIGFFNRCFHLQNDFKHSDCHLHCHTYDVLVPWAGMQSTYHCRLSVHKLEQHVLTQRLCAALQPGGVHQVL
jgi:predicted glycoside hydrolase/deacetylase ChbG (UPF0249 family)